MGEAPIHLLSGHIRPMPVIHDDPGISTVFGLGLSHMIRDTEIDTAWLLGEALNRHRAALAAAIGFRPSDLADAKDGTSGFAVSLVSVSGLTDAYCEGDTVALDLTVPPTAGNGWKSVTTLRSHAAAPVRVVIQGRNDAEPSPDRLSARTRPVSLDASLHLTPDGQIALPALIRLAETAEHDTLPKGALHSVVASRQIALYQPPGDTTALTSATERDVTPTGTRLTTDLIAPDCTALARVHSVRTSAGF